MSSIFIFIGGGVTAALVSLWILGYIAFGSAKCSGINTWAAVTLTVVAMIVIYFVIHSLDWLSDWIAAGTATKAAAAGQRDMREAFRDQREQSNALRALMQAMGQQAKTEKLINPETGPQVPRLGSGGIIFEGDGFMEEDT